jgi:hypothetical protein
MNGFISEKIPAFRAIFMTLLLPLFFHLLKIVGKRQVVD